ncbi:MAG TPA: ketopantoate reductase family protein, partial [Mycobacterium sp.]|nr:ketopantoate reductase family protein [Mycobacterium sp.]
MRVAIVGPGALGSVFGAALLRAENDVDFVGRPSPQLRALREKGLRLVERGGETVCLVAVAGDDPSVVSDADLVLVLVKSVDTSSVARSIAPFVRDGQPVLTLQNGLGNAERIRAEVGARARVLVGVTSQAATRLEPGVVAHTGAGPTVVGSASDNADEGAMAREVAAVFSAAGIPTAAVSDIQRWVWRKLAINAAINGLTALAGVPNGKIVEDPASLDAAEIVAEEVAAAARAHGWELGGMRRAVAETAAATAANRSSMLQDLDAGRPTEVAAIHEAVVAAAEAAGVATPATAVLSALIR